MISEQLAQSLNSPFFPPHTGAEPGRAKEESRITCMRMLRTTPPKSGEKPYLRVIHREHTLLLNRKRVNKEMD